LLPHTLYAIVTAITTAIAAAVAVVILEPQLLSYDMYLIKNMRFRNNTKSQFYNLQAAQNQNTDLFLYHQ
jgi:hypothetical protein